MVVVCSQCSMGRHYIFPFLSFLVCSKATRHALEISRSNAHSCCRVEPFYWVDWYTQRGERNLYRLSYWRCIFYLFNSLSHHTNLESYWMVYIGFEKPTEALSVVSSIIGRNTGHAYLWHNGYLYWFSNSTYQRRKISRIRGVSWFIMSNNGQEFVNYIEAELGKPYSITNNCMAVINRVRLKMGMEKLHPVPAVAIKSFYATWCNHYRIVFNC